MPKKGDGETPFVVKVGTTDNYKFYVKVDTAKLSYKGLVESIKEKYAEVVNKYAGAVPQKMKPKDVVVHALRTYQGMEIDESIPIQHVLGMDPVPDSPTIGVVLKQDVDRSPGISKWAFKGEALEFVVPRVGGGGGLADMAMADAASASGSEVSTPGGGDRMKKRKAEHVVTPTPSVTLSPTVQQALDVIVAGGAMKAGDVDEAALGRLAGLEDTVALQVLAKFGQAIVEQPAANKSRELMKITRDVAGPLSPTKAKKEEKKEGGGEEGGEKAGKKAKKEDDKEKKEAEKKAKDEEKKKKEEEKKAKEAAEKKKKEEEKKQKEEEKKKKKDEEKEKKAKEAAEKKKKDDEKKAKEAAEKKKKEEEKKAKEAAEKKKKEEEKKAKEAAEKKKKEEEEEVERKKQEQIRALHAQIALLQSPGKAAEAEKGDKKDDAKKEDKKKEEKKKEEKKKEEKKKEEKKEEKNEDAKKEDKKKEEPKKAPVKKAAPAAAPTEPSGKVASALQKVLDGAKVDAGRLDAGARAQLAQLASLDEDAAILACKRYGEALESKTVNNHSAFFITLMKKVRGEKNLDEYSATPRKSGGDSSDSESESDDSSDDEEGSGSGSDDDDDEEEESGGKSKSDDEDEEGEGEEHKAVPVVDVKGESDEDSTSSSSDNEESGDEGGGKGSDAGGGDSGSGSGGESDDDSDDLAGLVKGGAAATPGAAASGGKATPSSGKKAHHGFKSSVNESSINSAFEKAEGDGSVSTRVSSKGGKRKAEDGKGGGGKSAKS